MCHITDRAAASPAHAAKMMAVAIAILVEGPRPRAGGSGAIRGSCPM
jgi:hypothetical protein